MKDMSQKWLGKHQAQTVATLGTQDAALRQTKHNTKTMSNTDPTKTRGELMWSRRVGSSRFL